MNHALLAILAAAAFGCAAVQGGAEPDQTQAAQTQTNETQNTETQATGTRATETRAIETHTEPAGIPPSDPDSNLLADPSFESIDATPWRTFAGRSPAWVGFTIDDDRALHGQRSLLITLDSSDPDQPDATAVHGAYQQLRPRGLPRYMSGAYFVESWERGATNQYLQIVVIVQSPYPRPRGFSYSSMQVAVPLAGVTEDPIRIANRRFLIDCPPEPPVGEWVYFEHDIHELLESLWGVRPEQFSFVRVFVEARYDNRNTDRDPARALVRFDDIYLGPNPRRPTAADDDDTDDG